MMSKLFWCRQLIFALSILPKAVFLTDDIVVDAEEVKDLRRPIWNIAHMVNALYQVDYFLDRGANSLEFDVAFDIDGVARFVFHGIPCDCFRRCLQYENFDIFIDYLRQLTTPGDPLFRDELVLLFMDLKLNGLTPSTRFSAGQDVASKLLEHYWRKGASAGRANILVSVPSYNHMGFIRGFRSWLEKENATNFYSKIGFDFSANEDLSLIRSALESEEISDHIWLGDGITNCLPRGISRLMDALERRDQPGKSYLNKVYWWTVDKMSTMRRTLSLGVDGMITNYPERLKTVLSEEGISSQVRLAGYDDIPWKTHQNRMAKMMSIFPQAKRNNITEEILWN